MTCAGMSRHQMTVSSGSGGLHEAGEGGHEVAVAGSALLILESEPLGGELRARAEVGVVGLGQVQQSAVVPEVLPEELGMPVEPQPADDDRIEVSSEEVGEVEGRGFGVVDLVPLRVAGQEPVAVVARKTLDPVSLEHRV